jgi:hypothetical protein
LQNTSTSPANLTISYLSSGDSSAAWTTRRAIDPLGAINTSGVGPDEPPEGFVGSATVRALGGGSLVGVANQLRTGSIVGSAYRLPTEGSSSAYLPLVYRAFAGWDSGLQVENVGTTSTRVTVTFYQQDGSVATTVQDDLDPAASTTFYLPGVPNVPAGFVGSAIVTTSNGMPIVAVASHVK